MNLKTLKKLLESSWSAETASGNWDSNIPSLNQCAVTALIVQDFFGGDLLRCKMTNGGSHYWNRLPGGKQEDLSADQFQAVNYLPLKNDFIVRDREYVLSFPDTQKRYGILKARIDALLTSYT